ncbi:uroporphyrinogen-III synthase [Aeribacillus pallidus]|uniref:uroporphyrinogen-III synthase n=1 Tax=Aeribacillus TaxID=1055323 RepID=UPI0007B4ECB1|nr:MULTISPECIES: uroporphyrinogen-III synthase [Aeribacillus]KZM54957.1 hypothetical protein A3Q35_13480 [Aeribacillus pallidus]MED0649218.1 uroporphyrinogen-III synthase [Aeribacillus composti]MED4485782.1 uroporphyrinogen-III synthase [Aeribacillus pallidus]
MSAEKPLNGFNVLVTRANSQAAEFSKKIQAAGGCPIEVPLIATRKTETDFNALPVLKQLTSKDWIVFTSANGVQYFSEHVKDLSLELEDLKNVNVACVGIKTKKAAEKIGWKVSLCPEEFRAESLAEELIGHVRQDSKIVIARGNLARTYLREVLTEKKIFFFDFVVYETIQLLENEKEVLHLLENKTIDFITLTSSSTASAFMQIVKRNGLENRVRDIVFVCIGPITRDKLLSYKIKCTCIMPEKYTIDGMLEKMCTYAEKREE